MGHKWASMGASWGSAPPGLPTRHRQMPPSQDPSSSLCPTPGEALPTTAGARAGMVGRALLAWGHPRDPRYISAHSAGARLGGRRGAAVHSFGCCGTRGGMWPVHAVEDGRPRCCAEPDRRVSGGDTRMGHLHLRELCLQLRFSGMRKGMTASSSLEGVLRVAGLQCVSLGMRDG